MVLRMCNELLMDITQIENKFNELKDIAEHYDVEIDEEVLKDLLLKSIATLKD